MPNSAVPERAGALATWLALPRPDRVRIVGWMGFVAALGLLFTGPLTELVRHAARTELHSHVPLVPLIAAYLFHLRPTRALGYRTSLPGAVLTSGAGLAAVTLASAYAGSLSVNDYLAAMTLGFVCFVAAGCFLFFGSGWMRETAFPVAFLLFLVPLPDAAVYWLERGLVLASAEAAALLFRLTGTPLLRDGTVLALPGIVLEVAQECSGIRSSWVLAMTSVAAANMFLESPWRRAVLVAFVIPLAIARNGFRILVIGMLCVRIGPHMIDSLIHRRGGPLFFVLSLAPLFLLLFWLRRQERRRRPAVGRG